MTRRLDEDTEQSLATFLKDVRQLPNESAKTHRFATLLGELFPRSPVTTQIPAGIEKIVRIETAEGEKRGRIDTYYGNAVIEFEKSLEKSGGEAERQLREYVAGVWQKGGIRSLIAIASDGVEWRIYHPGLAGGSGKITPNRITLPLIRPFILTDKNLADFWLWLNGLLFRQARTEPTTQQFQDDFGASSVAYRDGIDALERAWKEVGSDPEPRLAYDTWRKYLTVTYGRLTSGKDGGKEKEIPDPEIEALFLKHTFLASIARLLIWAKLSGGKTNEQYREIAKHVLSGSYFESKNIANLVEDDFFQWVREPRAEETLGQVWERIIDQMLTYDLGHIGEDVFKGVYQQLVDPKDRHDLGEYYTPDWLCQRIVTDLLPAHGFASVLDPTCGSGSFLRATISHLLDRNAKGSDETRLQRILENVAGIDIHPLAVTIARTTYVLALGKLVNAAKRPIQVPVYLADSLFLPTEVQQYKLGSTPEFKLRFGDREVNIPESFVATPDQFDSGIAAAARIAVAHATSQKETEAKLKQYLQKAAPGVCNSENAEEVISSLWQFASALASLIRSRKNSIWAFIIRNSYRPAMMKGHFDFIVGNPPWLSYRYIADPEYQAEVKKRALTDYGIAPTSDNLFTQMELATVFFAHAVATFGNEDSRIAFVMPRSILSADQHTRLRTRSYTAPFRLSQYWDLRGVYPLFNVPSCVLFANWSKERGDPKDKLGVIEWSGKLPARDVPWPIAEKRLSYEKTCGGLIYLGQRTAFSTAEGITTPYSASEYAKRFQQGATILPQSFYFVRIQGLEGKRDPDKLYWAETDLKARENAKPPYDDIVMHGHVEGRFIYSTALSRNVLPFVFLNAETVVLPLIEKDGALQVVTADWLDDKGDREFAIWMRTVESLWNERRGDKAARQTVYQWLDYQGKLTKQNLRERHLVVYNAAGTNLSAAYVDRHSLPLPFVVEHKLYWIACDSQREADYLLAVLNSEAVNEEIKPFQSVGLMGERDIEKKVMDLPIRLFEPKNAIHAQLSTLGEKARLEAASLAQGALPKGLGRQRGYLRGSLAGTMKQIDEIVKELIKISA